MKILLLPVSLCALILAACASVEQPVDEAETEADRLVYPDTYRSTQTDILHGVAVDDPYRWLEMTHNPQTRTWVMQQNELTDQYLNGIDGRNAIKQRLTQLWNFPKLSAPIRYGAYYFHFQNNGLQDHSALYVREGLDGIPRRLLDPNTLSEDGTLSVARIAVSPNARYLAYALADSGSDWVEFRVRDIATGEDLDDVIRGVKFSNVSWLPDESGFYYSRYPDTPAGDPDDRQPVAIYFHRLGSAQSNDRRIYDLSRYSAANPYPEVTRDGRFLIANVSEGFSSNAVHVLDLTRTDARWQPIINHWDGHYQFIDSDANLLFFQTTAGAPQGRVIAVDMNRPQAQYWEEIIPQQEATLRDVSYVGGKFFAHYLEDASSQIDVFNAYGRHERRLDLPGIGSVDKLTGSASQLETFFTFTSFTEAALNMRYDIANDELEVIERAQVFANLEKIQTRRVSFPSSDGTEVSMFLVYRSDLQLNGNNPALLYGYGGFNIPVTPSFNPAWVAWVERGGVLAVPNLRGGGEYGAEWHEAGTQEHKQNVFDDFIAAAEYLIDEGFTRTDNLAISGRSNGGLLVGAVLSQRPDLFAAALPDVGVFDMLRYHTSSANARSWQSDFGIASNEEDFTYLHAYSPLHNLDTNRCYPATLVTTGEHDDRVAPWHSYKFTAALQHAQACDNPILLRVETHAGHGSGSPIWMQIEQISDQWAFLLEHLASGQLQSPAQSSNLEPES